jgi:hypothetical protein
MKKLLLPLLFAVLFGSSASSFALASLYSSGFEGGFGSVYSFNTSRAISASSFANPSLVRAAHIAQRRAFPHSQMRCWKYVKDALLEAGAVESRPSSSYAFQAGEELTRRYGFVDSGLRDPYRAPVGAVIVYGGHGAGHVELRTERGFASDYRSPYRCKYSHVIGIYVKGHATEIAQAY